MYRKEEGAPLVTALVGWKDEVILCWITNFAILLPTLALYGYFPICKYLGYLYKGLVEKGGGYIAYSAAKNL